MIRAVKGMIVQILENLISNSLYWIEMRSAREPSLKPEIRITLESGPPTLTYEDNGRGIALSNADKIFRPFWSLKERKVRRGLGLFIAKEAAERHNRPMLAPRPIRLPSKRRVTTPVLLPASRAAATSRACAGLGSRRSPTSPSAAFRGTGTGISTNACARAVPSASRSPAAIVALGADGASSSVRRG
jgi:hypothetical protein